MGFFAEVGPLNVFVSSHVSSLLSYGNTWHFSLTPPPFLPLGFLSGHQCNELIPPDMKFDPNSNPPCFNNPEEQVSIERNARVRLKIVGTRVDATEIVSFLL